jgi:outer membrane lipoprotein-sorting protein
MVYPRDAVHRLWFIVINRLCFSNVFVFWVSLFLSFTVKAQTAEEIIQKVKTKLNKVDDYEAKGKLKTNVIFIKAPVATVKVYYKKPNKLKINNESGISFIPKGSVNINLNNIFVNTGGFDIIDVGKESGTNLRIIKLLPKDENSDVVLSTLYIDEAQSLIKKSKTTTKDNGTYELEMTYGKYSDYGLADKVIFLFNTKDYKLPKGVTFDYDDGSKKEQTPDKQKNKKGKVEITYSNYVINKGVPDSIFQ